MASNCSQCTHLRLLLLATLFAIIGRTHQCGTTDVGCRTLDCYHLHLTSLMQSSSSSYPSSSPKSHVFNNHYASIHLHDASSLHVNRILWTELKVSSRYIQSFIAFTKCKKIPKYVSKVMFKEYRFGVACGCSPVTFVYIRESTDWREQN